MPPNIGIKLGAASKNRIERYLENHNKEKGNID